MFLFGSWRLETFSVKIMIYTIPWLIPFNIQLCSPSPGVEFRPRIKGPLLGLGSRRKNHLYRQHGREDQLTGKHGQADRLADQHGHEAGPLPAKLGHFWKQNDPQNSLTNFQSAATKFQHKPNEEWILEETGKTIKWVEWNNKKGHEI